MSRAAGLLIGFVADQVFGDPRRAHPVAAFGTIATAVESRTWADSRPRGTVYAAGLVGGATLLGALAERVTRDHPLAHTAVLGAATWAVLGGSSLSREAAEMSRLLAAGDLAGGRNQVTHLVGRDPTDLDAADLARATVESVAENTSDAVVAPLLLGAMFGVPGLLGYRAANTLDAMVGHRTQRYERFGWAAARLDDALNLAPARLAGVLAVLSAPVVGGRPHHAITAWRRDAAEHPSPNAGVVEATFAGALGVSLGGTNVYSGRTEHRVVLGVGRAPVVSDIARSITLARTVDWAALVVCVSLARTPRRRPRRRR